MSMHLPILQTLARTEAARGVPLSAQELGDALNKDPRKVYASMSGMGRWGNRNWIEPVVYQWGRRTRFRITEAGRKRIVELENGKRW